MFSVSSCFSRNLQMICLCYNQFRCNRCYKTDRIGILLRILHSVAFCPGALCPGEGRCSGDICLGKKLICVLCTMIGQVAGEVGVESPYPGGCNYPHLAYSDKCLPRQMSTRTINPGLMSEHLFAPLM